MDLGHLMGRVAAFCELRNGLSAGILQALSELAVELVRIARTGLLCCSAKRLIVFFRYLFGAVVLVLLPFLNLLFPYFPNTRQCPYLWTWIRFDQTLSRADRDTHRHIDL